ncbi:MAG: peptidoglycan-binding domain-containing protein [Acidobacteriaceae bacterium]
MLFVRACQTILLITALAAAPAFASRVHRPATSGHHHHARRRHSRKARHHIARGQRGIDTERASQIQAALIKQNYLTGAPSGEWDSATEDAMKKYQADHGWQTKTTPDSRALIALGLGPDRDADGIPVVTAKAATTVAAPTPAPNTLASMHIIEN